MTKLLQIVLLVAAIHFIAMPTGAFFWSASNLLKSKVGPITCQPTGKCLREGEEVGPETEHQWNESCDRFNKSQVDDFLARIKFGKAIPEPETLPFMAMLYKRLPKMKLLNLSERNPNFTRSDGYGSSKPVCMEAYEDHPIGSGAILHPEIIITSAHQFVHSKARIHFVGTGDDYIHSWLHTQQHSQVDKVVVHPYYNLSPSLFDIALIKLTRPLKLREGVWPICMDRIPEVIDPITSKSKLRVAGWSVGRNINETQNLLVREDARPVRSLEECCRTHNIRVSTFAAKRPTRIYNNYRCMEADRKNANKRRCFGLFSQVLYQSLPSGNSILRGISVNTGQNCKPNAPLVFVDIRRHQKWIHETMVELLANVTSNVAPSERLGDWITLHLPSTEDDC